jgi:hypothetical protein
MALTAKLFRGDAALEACLVRDAAHIPPGSKGPHVARIQRALAILDGALIDGSEATQSLYGRTTASAVLDYKRARRIINFSYEQQADNIVGKMTIASLDKEMSAAEQRPRSRPCSDPAIGIGGGGGGGGAVFQPGPRLAFSIGQEAAAGGSALRDAAPAQQFPAILSVLMQLVRVKDQLGPFSFQLANELSPAANKLLEPFGMRLARVVGFSLSFPFKPKYGEEDEFEGLRKAAEKEMSGFRAAVRVLICPFRGHDENGNDTTNNAVSLDVKGFDRFIVLNSNTLRADRGTLLHEMIHCSDPALMGDAAHDAIDSDSIFSWNAKRTRLRPEHARALQGAFFALKRG